MREKTYQRLKADVIEAMQGELEQIFSRIAQAEIEIAERYAEKHMQRAISDKVSGETFLDEIVDRILRKQLDLGQVPKARGLRRAAPDA